MMTSSQIRQSFLDFFKSKQHTIVPSSSLMPDSPNLLFTNAGMNQFVPIFLGQTQCPYLPGRAADTQKCIRTGGKHNDLEDVGVDTYHHTFFEMLGNWSFGDYFKREAIDWAWELVVGKWKFPANRLYATVYSPDKSKNDPSEFDQEAWDCWAEKFRAAGLDPKIHIVSGNKKDNFWMMGETGPCGPCSELHVDLTSNGDTNGKLVNAGSPQCIEIWNLVFIQFNANPDGTFSPLPARHVDTGMGFERVASIIQGTKNFSDFANAKISNYETDIFSPTFEFLERLSKCRYGHTMPTTVFDGHLVPKGEDELRDVAFRVIADHIRTLSFAIADGIQPGNTDRNYVLRRILRRAVRYGRTLGFHEPFFYKLVDVLADTMGDVFPEIRARKKQVQETIRTEEEAFNKTLDAGIQIFDNIVRLRENFFSAVINAQHYLKNVVAIDKSEDTSPEIAEKLFNDLRSAGQTILDAFDSSDWNVMLRTPTKSDRELLERAKNVVEVISATFSGEVPEEVFDFAAEQTLHHQNSLINQLRRVKAQGRLISGAAAFLLYDTYGFPLDLTELMARERGLSVDKDGFEKLMEEQRARARAAQKKEVISLSQIETTAPTKFTGFEKLESPARVLEVVSVKDKTAVVLDTSPFYAEMGGQVGDTGEISGGGNLWRISNTQKSGNTWLHFLEVEQASGLSASASRRSTAAASGGTPDTTAETAVPPIGSTVSLSVDTNRRHAIERHHTVTHLLHWALHKVASKDASQKGSFVGPDKLTFDFNSAPLTPQQIADVEKLVNEKILENEIVSWTEVPHADVKNRKDVMQFFGDKYGDTVRVVQIGGDAEKLNGYSMELCGGTHVRATGEIGLFRIVGESAIAAGVRRIEAVAGLESYRRANDELHLIKTVAAKVGSPVHELEKKIESLLAHQKELEKSLRAATMKAAADNAKSLLARAETLNGTPAIIARLDGDGDTLQAVTDALKSQFKGVMVLGGAANGAVSLVAAVSPDFTAKIQAGKIIQQIAPIVGGKGGGRPDNARGGGKDLNKLDEALARAKSLVNG
jgi:alanyl-tRNA synthetase